MKKKFLFLTVLGAFAMNIVPITAQDLETVEWILASIHQNDYDWLESMLEENKNNPDFDINKGDRMLGDTPLAVAADNKHINMVKLLLEHGAHPDTSEKECLTPLQLAVIHDQIEIARLLLAHNATPDYVDTACAKRRQYKRVPRYPADETPLLLAVNRKNIPMITLLLDYGADPHLPLSRNFPSSPYHAAKERKLHSIVELFDTHIIKHKRTQAFRKKLSEPHSKNLRDIGFQFQ